MTTLGEYPPHFRARVSFRAVADGGPRNGIFGFPDSGRRDVPLELADLEGLNTVQLRFEPDELVSAGSSIEVECRFMSEEIFVGRIHEGTEFGIWDGGIIADGVVLQVHDENWSSNADG